MSSNRHSSSSGPSRVIFIGNIPFDITEEQVIDIFKEVGPVQSFRLMFDRETGRSRGYAFCEYADYETAASAIRNLNGYEINGRALKVDRADNDMLPSHFSSGSGTAMPATQLKPVQNLPGVPPSASASAVHAVLSAPPFTEPQTLLDVVSSLKATIQSNPQQARQVLASNPALSYALLQSFVALNLVDMSTVQSLLIQSQNTMQNRPTETPSAAQSAEQQRNLIMQIMNMTPEQINMLPPAQRDQVLQLRQQIAQQQQQQAVRQ